MSYSSITFWHCNFLFFSPGKFYLFDLNIFLALEQLTSIAQSLDVSTQTENSTQVNTVCFLNTFAYPRIHMIGILWTSALPMGFPPWLSCMLTDCHLIVWWVWTWSVHKQHGRSALYMVVMQRVGRLPWQPIAILKFRFREVFSVPIPDLPAKFGARRSINGRGRDATQIIVR